MADYRILRTFGLAIMIGTVCNSFALGATPVDQKPEFLGDFYFVDDAEQATPPLRLVSTKLELFVPKNGYRSYSEYVAVTYKVRNESQRDTFRLALVGENIKIYANGETSFTRSYVKHDRLPAEIVERLDKYFDYYYDNTQLPINTFELKVAPNETTSFNIYYRNSRNQFANHYDDVCIFHFWLNPIFDGDVAMEFEIENSLDTSVIGTPNKKLVYNSDRLEFSHALSRPGVANNVISFRFPFIPKPKVVAPSFSERLTGLLAAVDKMFPRSSLFGLGIIVGLALMAGSQWLIRSFGKTSKENRISRTTKTNSV